jgi:hypothetical protein
VVRSYMHRKRLPRQTDGWSALISGVLRTVCAGRRPHLQENCVSMWGRSHTQGRQERQSCPPLHLPLTRGHRSRRGLRPSHFHCHSVAHRSLSSRTHISSLEACLASHPTASVGGSASRGHPQDPMQECERTEKIEL